MKRTASFTLLTALAALISCTKATPEHTPNQEIVLGIDDVNIDIDVHTRASAISSIPSTLYWGCTTGTSSQANKSYSSKSVSSGQIYTGLYQTASPTTYNHYLSNVSMSHTSSGPTISASNSTDVIAGYTSSNSTAPSVTLNHIFARTGSLSISATNGYTFTATSWSIKSVSGGTSGTYNLYSGAWSNMTSLGSTTIYSSSDLYLIPGTYTITVSGTLSYGDYSISKTASANITLVAGKINNISASISGSGATQIVISTSLTSWGTTTLSPTVS